MPNPSNRDLSLVLVLSLFVPVAALSQETAADCDPSDDPTCVVTESPPEPGQDDSDKTSSDEAEATETTGSDARDGEVAAEADESPLEPAAASSAEDGGATAVEGETAESETQATAEPEAQEQKETGEAADAASEALDIEEPETILSEDTGLTEEAASVEATAAEKLADNPPVAAAEGDEGADDGQVEVTTMTEENTRSSEDEFPSASADDALSPLQKLLLAGIGAAVVGELIDDSRIVQNTGDRVVVQRADGSLYVLRDDDVLLRRPGDEVSTRTYTDGSTVSEITKSDGSIVRTVRDARGLVLRRTRVLPSGMEIVLFDDTSEFDPVVVEKLPLTRSSSVDYSQDDASLGEALAADIQADIGRRFSLRQIRNIRAVRELVPVIDLETITFDTNSAAIRTSEAQKLVRLGSAMKAAVDQRPWEVFLIEGHTDAVGSAVANLTLSDRRAESLALALSEYSDIPSENLVVQGYGERYLKVPVDTDERANRRVTVRRITPLLGMEMAASSAPAVSGNDSNMDAPEQLALFGDGYPGAGDPCTRAGESDFTRDFLDDSADLVACPPSVDADLFSSNLGGQEVAAFDGWSLISIPRRPESRGDGMPTIGSPTDVTDFEGARAGQAEMGLQALGYEATRSEGLTTYWFNRDTGACARIRTADGRYSEVTMLPAQDC
ncbi:OmpA family protein [Defluviimonas sp. SAOS-178_SWC]|uniref:OmpA family protein n=1 Tax=Defluviimonas sp. SAOS-178_SWC TaxID=3121287 RepID=UPI003221FB04